MNLHITALDQPGHSRATVTVRRFGEARVLHHDGPTEQAEDAATKLLLEGIISKLDRFGARAFDIPAHHRNEQHLPAIETFTGAVGELNPPMSPPTAQACLPLLRVAVGVCPLLLGTIHYEGHNERRDEYVELRALCFTLAARLEAQPVRSCRMCMLPAGHAQCTHQQN